MEIKAKWKKAWKKRCFFPGIKSKKKTCFTAKNGVLKAKSNFSTILYNIAFASADKPETLNDQISLKEIVNEMIDGHSIDIISVKAEVTVHYLPV